MGLASTDFSVGMEISACIAPTATSWNRTYDRNDSCTVSGSKLKTMLVTGRKHGRGLQRQAHAINLAFGSEKEKFIGGAKRPRRSSNCGTLLNLNEGRKRRDRDKQQQLPWGFCSAQSDLCLHRGWNFQFSIFGISCRICSYFLYDEATVYIDVMERQQEMKFSFTWD